MIEVFKVDLGPEAKLTVFEDAGSLGMKLEHKGANGGDEVLQVTEPLVQPIEALLAKLEAVIPGDQAELLKLVDAALEGYLK